MNTQTKVAIGAGAAAALALLVWKCPFKKESELMAPDYSYPSDTSPYGTSAARTSAAATARRKVQPSTKQTLSTPLFRYDNPDKYIIE